MTMRGAASYCHEYFSGEKSRDPGSDRRPAPLDLGHQTPSPTPPKENLLFGGK